MTRALKQFHPRNIADDAKSIKLFELVLTLRAHDCVNRSGSAQHNQKPMSGRKCPMLSRCMTRAIASLAFGVLAAASASAQDTVKIGLVMAMTGEQASTGKQIKAAVDLYMKQHGDTVAGKKIEVILRDSGSVPDKTKRLAQELIVNDKVNVIAGFEITPAALAVAPLATEAKVVELVMAAGTSIIPAKSPYIVRTSDTVPQSSVIIADWAAMNEIKKVVTIVSDYAPGFDADKSFTERFKAAGGMGVGANT